MRRVVGVNVSARSTCGSLVKKGRDGGGAKKQGGVARVHRKGCTDYRKFQDVHQSSSIDPMKRTLLLLLLPLLLTSCSNPDTSGGVTLAKGGGDHHNNFPNGSCKGSHQFDNHQKKTGCGWVTANGKSSYIMSGAILRWADLTDANLSGVVLHSSTTCPNGKKRGTAGNNCWF